MKDPLQTEQSPYEFLGVNEGASDADIDQAFKTGVVGRRSELSELRTARTCLRRPVDRAMVDMMRFDDDVVCNLVPDPSENPAVLEPARRLATAQSWERELRRSFPDYGVAHSLAVLYYWWAVHQESRAEDSTETDGTPPPDGTELWRKAIGYWSMCLSADEFGRGVMGVDAATREELKNRFRAGLLSRFQDLGQQCRERGQAGLADCYSQLELEFSTELRTAAEVYNSHVRTGAGRICCGAQLLRDFRLLDNIRGQIAAGLERDPEDSRLKDLRLALSDYVQIYSLIESKDYRAAATAIEALSPDQRKTDEVRSLCCAAMLELGGQEEDVGRHAEAIDCWGKVVEAGPDSQEAEDARSKLVSMCRRLASAWGRERRSETIELLEHALGALRDSSLEALLADKMTDEAARIINDAQDEEQSDRELTGRDEQELRERMQHALDLLERAVKLGLERSREQLETGREVVDRILRLLRLSPGARQLMRRAVKAEQAENLDEAIDALSKLVDLLEEESAEDLEQNLSVALCKRGVVRIHAAITTLKAARDRLQSELAQLGSASSHLSRLARSGLLSRINEDVCARRGEPLHGSYYTFSTPDGRSVRVCSKCGEYINSLIRAAKTLGSKGRKLAREGYLDVAEAHELDPTNEHASEQLKQAKEFLNQCEVEIPKPEEHTAAKHVWSVVWGSMIVLIGMAILLQSAGELWFLYIPLCIWGAYGLIDGIGGLRKLRADSAKRRRRKSTRGGEKPSAGRSRQVVSGDVNWDARCQCGSGKVYRKCCGRNAPCPCGSGEKYRLCCGKKDSVNAGGITPSVVEAAFCNYGVQLDGDKMFLFVKQNTRYPTPLNERVWLTLRTSRPYQRILLVPVYGGDDEEQASANEHQGEACLLLPAGLPGKAEVRMRLWLDKDGCIQLEAATGNSDRSIPAKTGQKVLCRLLRGEKDHSSLESLQKLEQKCLDSHGTSDKKRRAKLRTGLSKAFKAWIGGEYEEVELIVKELLYGTPSAADPDPTGGSRKR